jgi:hypothetical protein
MRFSNLKEKGQANGSKSDGSSSLHGTGVLLVVGGCLREVCGLGIGSSSISVLGSEDEIGRGGGDHGGVGSPGSIGANGAVGGLLGTVVGGNSGSGELGVRGHVSGQGNGGEESEGEHYGKCVGGEWSEMGLESIYEKAVSQSEPNRAIRIPRKCLHTGVCNLTERERG